MHGSKEELWGIMNTYIHVFNTGNMILRELDSSAVEPKDLGSTLAHELL